MNKFMMGYDYILFQEYGMKIPIYAPAGSHLIVIGGSGSGKTTAVLYWLYKLTSNNIKIYIADFKKSREFYGITKYYAEFEQSYELIKQFYNDFLSTPEGGDGTIKILLIDEIAGLLMHFSATKDGKAKAD